MNNLKQRIFDRALQEWRLHGKLILTLDFDDTIYPLRMLTQKECDEIIDFIKWVQSYDILYTVIFTASNNDRHEYIKNYCDSKGLKIDSINCNPIDLQYGKEGKIYYNYFLCDRSGDLKASFDLFQEIAKKRITEINEVNSLGNV